MFITHSPHLHILTHTHHTLITHSPHTHHTLITQSSHTHHTLTTHSSHTHHTLITHLSHTHHTLIIHSSHTHTQHTLIKHSSHTHHTLITHSPHLHSRRHEHGAGEGSAITKMWNVAEEECWGRVLFDVVSTSFRTRSITHLFDVVYTCLRNLIKKHPLKPSHHASFELLVLWRKTQGQYGNLNTYQVSIMVKHNNQ